jgi:tetratricopeptide (TPR) repeat protein
MAFRLLGRRREAIEQFRAALTLDPADFPAHFNLGLLLEEQGSAEEALGHYREAVRIDPGNAKARTMLGQALQRQR